MEMTSSDVKPAAASEASPKTAGEASLLLPAVDVKDWLIKPVLQGISDIKQNPSDILGNTEPCKTISAQAYNDLMWLFLGLPEMQVIRLEDVKLEKCFYAGYAAAYEACIDGVSVALKVACVGGAGSMVSQGLANEIRVYQKLVQLQGNVIPKINAYGLIKNKAGSFFPFLAMEKIDGSTLDDAIDGMSEEAVPGAIKAVVQAFKELHAAGYIHGCIIPQSVLLRSDGSAVIVGFERGREAGYTMEHSRAQSIVVNAPYNPLLDDIQLDYLSQEKTKVHDMLVDLIKNKLEIERHEAQAKLVEWAPDVGRTEETQLCCEPIIRDWHTQIMRLFIGLKDARVVRFEDVRLRKVLGSGNAGTVHRAHMYGLPVAMKVAHMCNGTTTSCISTLINEIKVYEGLKALQGSSIPRLLTYGLFESKLGLLLPFLAMRQIDGCTLDQAVYNMSGKEVTDIAKAVLKAYKQLHAAGYTQGSVKPPNVMVDRSGKPVIIDFGRGQQVECSAERMERQSMVVNVLYGGVFDIQPDYRSAEISFVKYMLTKLLSSKLRMCKTEAREKMKQWTDEVSKELQTVTAEKTDAV